MRKLAVVALIGMISIMGIGCASMPNSSSTIAEIIMIQLEASLASAQEALNVVNDGQGDSQAVQDAISILRIAKPQIVGWIETIELIRKTNQQYESFESLKSQYNVIAPQIDAVVQ